MNLTETQPKPLQLIVRPNMTLSAAQQDLYTLVCEKLKVNKSITYEEAQKIYFEKGCKIMKDGWPHYFYQVQNNETKQWEDHSRPIHEDEVKYMTFNWLTFNIGKLVIKGYLKIIPQIELG